MALEEFWQNVRRAARLIRPPNAVADSPRIHADEISRRLASDDLWLVRGAVFGYDGKDFEFLPPEELDRLTTAVKTFHDVAKMVDPRVPATDAQVEAARPAFERIVGRLEFDRFADAEAFRLGKRIESCLLADGWPAELAELRFETGPDSTGDPGLWVWAFVAETGEHDEGAFHSAAAEIDRVLDPLTRDIAPDRWPYILFRSTLDQLELEAAAR